MKSKKYLLLLVFLIVCCNVAYAKASKKCQVAICAIFQNEAPYLKEWIEFHRLVGVKHFYLYNNLSTDRYKAVLNPYIKSGVVELIEWPYLSSNVSEWNRIQTDAYRDAIKRSRGNAKWLAILDTDEFLFPVEMDDLGAFLTGYMEYAVVCANWQMYGTSDVEKIFPGHLLIEDLIYKGPEDYPENIHVKSIVRPELVQDICNPHHCILKPNQLQVNSNKQSFTGPYAHVVINKIRINHYWTRDLDFFHRVKLGRRSKWSDEISLQRASMINCVEDTTIHKYVPRLKKAMGYK